MIAFFTFNYNGCTAFVFQIHMPLYATRPGFLARPMRRVIGPLQGQTRLDCQDAGSKIVSGRGTHKLRGIMTDPRR